MKKPLGIRVGRVILEILRPLMSIFFPYTIVNREKAPTEDGSLVVCCNHISLLDPIYLFLACPQPIYFMAKGELFKFPPFAWFLKTVFGVFPVARGKGDFTAISHSLSILKDGHILGIFPEGTRSKTGELGPVKSGTSLIISKAQSPVLPCVLFTNKGGRVRLFKKTTIVFGDVMTPEDLHLTGEKPDIRYASRMLSSTFTTLLEENRV